MFEDLSMFNDIVAWGLTGVLTVLCVTDDEDNPHVPGELPREPVKELVLHQTHVTNTTGSAMLLYTQEMGTSNHFITMTDRQ
jgi:hypothetical protein